MRILDTMKLHKHIYIYIYSFIFTYIYKYVYTSTLNSGFMRVTCWSLSTSGTRADDDSHNNEYIKTQSHHPQVAYITLVRVNTSTHTYIIRTHTHKHTHLYVRSKSVYYYRITYYSGITRYFDRQNRQWPSKFDCKIIIIIVITAIKNKSN